MLYASIPVKGLLGNMVRLDCRKFYITENPRENEGNSLRLHAIVWLLWDSENIGLKFGRDFSHYFISISVPGYNPPNI